MKTIYLDMDDVVADFKQYAKRVLTQPQVNGKWESTEWNRLKDNARLYRDLEKTPEADQLVDECLRVCELHNWALKFLTAVPKGNDVRWAFYDKVVWAQRNYPGIPVMFGPYSHDKHVHCVPGDVLIDDRTSNCEQWRAVGGVAIQHRGDIEQTLTELRLVS